VQRGNSFGRVQVLSICSIVLLALGLVGGTSVAAAVPEPELLTGDVWQRMSADAKMAYIVGLGNLVEYERHQLADSPPATSKSFLPHLARGRSGISVNEVVSHIDAYYAAHSEQLKRPVVDTIFQAIVLPRLKAAIAGGAPATSQEVPFELSRWTMVARM
jgi:hypothetical protein